MPHKNVTIAQNDRAQRFDDDDDNTPQLVAHLGSIKRHNTPPQLVAHLGSTAIKRRTSVSEASLQAAIAELTDDMELLRTAPPSKFVATISRLLEERHAPMLLLDARELDARERLPCYDEVEAKLVPYSKVGPDDTVIFVSHRWWLPGVPDGAHGEKVAIVNEILKTVVAPQKAGGRVLLWWDFFSIAQKGAEIHAAVKGAQILAIPFYLAAADTLIALRGGDETSYAPSVMSSSDAGLSHPGRYGNRVWTMLELFGFTSEFAILCHGQRFQRDVRASGRRVVDCTLAYDSAAKRLVASAVQSDDSTMESVRAALHDTPGWTLPPGDNLTDKNDLRFIQPMVIALATESSASSAVQMPPALAPKAPKTRFGSFRLGKGTATSANSSTTNAASAPKASLAHLLRTAASFGFEHAVTSFIDLLKEQDQLTASIDSEDEAGHTALSRAVFANQPKIVSRLIAEGADVTKVHPKLQTPPLLLALSLRRAECASILLDTYAAKSLALPVDRVGRTCLHLAACTGEAAAAGDHSSSADAPKLAQMARLMELGVDPAARDSTGRTPLDLLHATNAHATLAEVEKLMSDEKIALCMPRKTVEHQLELPPVPRLAKRVTGTWSPGVNAAGATYTFDRFEPASGAALVGGKTGPKIFLLPFAHNEASHELMELLVAQFDATCLMLHCFTPALAVGHRQPKGVWSSSMVASHIEQFIDAHCDGKVDLAVGWCKPGEWLARVAVSSPQKIGAIALTSTPAAPDSAEEEKGFLSFMNHMLETATPCEIGQCMLQQSAPCFSHPSRTAIAEHHGQVLFDSWFINAKEQGTFAPGGWFEDFYNNTRYWRHWDKVRQPLLLIAGADDSSMIVGMENLVAIVPNGRMEWVAGVAHMPFIEAPQWYRQKFLEFVAVQGFERMQVEEL